MGRNSVIKFNGSMMFVRQSQLGEKVAAIIGQGLDRVKVQVMLPNDLPTDKVKVKELDKDIPGVCSSLGFINCGHPLIAKEECKVYTLYGNQPILEISMKNLSSMAEKKPPETMAQTINNIVSYAHEQVTNIIRNYA